jgi:hypothetical protein
MRSTYRILIPVLGVAMLFWTGVTKAAAQEHSQSMGANSSKEEMGGHSHERCELHGGNVAMTKAHHVETVFAPDGIRIYMYSDEQNPLPMDKVSGTVTMKDKAGTAREVKLVANVPKKGEQVVYYCTMYDSAPQMTPGKCPVCGMNLVPQSGLFAAADLSKAAPGSVKAIVKLTGMDGDEKNVTFTETNITEKEESKTPAGKAPAGTQKPTPTD